MSEENLWGELPKVEKTDTPAIILKKQAQYLTDMTNGLLDGQVSINKANLSSITCNFYITVPTLGGYSIKILYMSYGLSLYPVSISDVVNNLGYQSSNEMSFRDDLKKIFQSEGVKKIITSLLIQVQNDEN